MLVKHRRITMATPKQELLHYFGKVSEAHREKSNTHTCTQMMPCQTKKNVVKLILHILNYPCVLNKSIIRKWTDLTMASSFLSLELIENCISLCRNILTSEWRCVWSFGPCIHTHTAHRAHNVLDRMRIRAIGCDREQRGAHISLFRTYIKQINDIKMKPASENNCQNMTAHSFGVLKQSRGLIRYTRIFEWNKCYLGGAFFPGRKIFPNVREYFD